MPIIVYPYIQGSGSVQALREEGKKQFIVVKELLLENSRYVQRDGHIALNWGRSNLKGNPEFMKNGNRIINSALAVSQCTNKLTFFRAMQDGPRIPHYTTDREAAEKWQLEGHMVCERHKLDGHSAEGLVIKEPHEQLARAPLYTRYVKKKDEYRIHLYRHPNNDHEDNIDIRQIFAQKKVHPNAQANGQEGINWKIRNRNNGFIFQRNNLVVPADVFKQASLAFAKSGLDFGAVDVVYQQASDKAYVLEINTAPGLEGQSVKEYFDVIKMIGERKLNEARNI
jgi:hypothetical protein